MGKSEKPPVTSTATATGSGEAAKAAAQPGVDLDLDGGAQQGQLADIAGHEGAGNAMAQDMMTGTGTGTGQDLAPATDVPQAATSTAAPATQEGDEERELSDDEVQEEIDNAHAAAGPAKEDGAGAQGDPAAEGGEAAAKEEVKGEGPAATAAGPAAAGGMCVQADSSAMPPFQICKATDPLSRWDNEVSWHDAFKNPGQCSQNFEVDRAALIGDALGGGFLAGVEAGAINVLMDSAVNVAATKIPYISGFVELAQIAYDPEAWLQAQSQATFGKFSKGFDQIINGDAWDKVEGTVNLLSGAVGVIGLLTNICWIIAGVGFLASFICPALLPFVALCTSWATSLSAISGIAYLILSLLQLGLVGMRATEIAVSDADPEDLLASGKSLEDNTKGFTATYTTRAGGNLRQRAANKMSGRDPASKPDTPYKRREEKKDDPSGWFKALDVVTGNVAHEKGLGHASKGAVDSAKSARGNAAKAEDAFFGRGDYKRGGEDGPVNTTAQKLADMEHAGANVFHSTNAREDFYKQQADKDGHGVKARAQDDSHTKWTPYFQEKDEAHAKMAADRRAKRDRAQQDLDDAQAALRKAEQDSAATISAKSDEVRTRKALQASYEEDLALAQTQLGDLRQRRALLAGDDPATKQRQAAVDGQITAARARVTQATADVAEARAYHAEGQAELQLARKPVEAAQSSVDSAQSSFDKQSRMSELSDRRAQQSDNERIEMEHLGATKPAGGKGVDAILAEEQKAEQHDIFQAMAGKGPSAVHGMKRRHDRALIKRVQSNATDKEEAGGPLGLWQNTMDEKEIDWVGNQGGQAMNQTDNTDWFERFVTGVGDSLPAIPIHCPDEVDGSAAAWEELEGEEYELSQQAAVMDELIGAGHSEISEMQGVQQVADQNLTAVDNHQAALEERKAKQDEATAQAQEAQGQMQEGSGKAGEGAGKTGGIVGRFLDMLNIVPTRILPGGQEAKDGINQLGEASSASVDATAQGTQGAEEAQSAVTAMKEATTATQGTDQAAATQLSAIQADASVKEASATEGVEEMTSTRQQAAERLTLLAQEQERLELVHDGHVQEAGGWTSVHETTRIKGMGDYADVLKLSQK